MKVFLSTLSLRRATPAKAAVPATMQNFYPRSPCGERLWRFSTTSRSWHNFYPRSPCGERRAILRIDFSREENFYPRSPCGERRCRGCRSRSRCGISIHALLAESDRWTPKNIRTQSNFYPRSPCGERRQSTSKGLSSHYFYPRSPCGERPTTTAVWAWHPSFLSTLSLRRATGRPSQRIARSKFLSTLSLRRATGVAIQQQLLTDISIHALLAESDAETDADLWDRIQFLSTLSLRRATVKKRTGCTRVQISIHALLAESDSPRCGWLQVVYYFYPRSPCGERLLGRGAVV